MHLISLATFPPVFLEHLAERAWVPAQEGMDDSLKADTWRLLLVAGLNISSATTLANPPELVAASHHPPRRCPP